MTGPTKLEIFLAMIELAAKGTTAQRSYCNFLEDPCQARMTGLTKREAKGTKARWLEQQPVTSQATSDRANKT